MDQNFFYLNLMKKGALNKLVVWEPPVQLEMETGGFGTQFWLGPVNTQTLVTMYLTLHSDINFWTFCFKVWTRLLPSLTCWVLQEITRERVVRKLSPLLSPHNPPPPPNNPIPTTLGLTGNRPKGAKGARRKDPEVVMLDNFHTWSYIHTSYTSLHPVNWY